MLTHLSPAMQLALILIVLAVITFLAVYGSARALHIDPQNATRPSVGAPGRSRSVGPSSAEAVAGYPEDGDADAVSQGESTRRAIDAIVVALWEESPICMVCSQKVEAPADATTFSPARLSGRSLLVHQRCHTRAIRQELSAIHRNAHRFGKL